MTDLSTGNIADNGIDLAQSFIAADQLLRQTLAGKHHSSIQQPQVLLGGLTPVQHIAKGGNIETILNMFPAQNYGG